MVTIAQALISKPRILLIDEMSLCLAPVIIDRQIDLIRTLLAQGIGTLLIEQFSQLAFDVVDYCYVLSQEKFRFEERPEHLKSDRSILEKAYLET